MADRSRMNREAHVRICEGLGVKFPQATRLQGVGLMISKLNRLDFLASIFQG
jgi:hypothetical protein